MDGVVGALLGGGVSPDTRAILITGKNPFLGIGRRARHDAGDAAKPKAPVDPDEALLDAPGSGSGPGGEWTRRATAHLEDCSRLHEGTGADRRARDRFARIPEEMENTMHRRYFVKSGAVALVTMGLSPSFLRRTAIGMELPLAQKGKVLICLFQRGAADALNVVVPHGERAYYELRPNIAIPQPLRGAGAAGAIDLDGFFGLHPSLAPLKPLWDNGHARADPCGRESEHHALALRRAGLHGERHARREGDDATAGSTGISRRRGRASSARPRRSARWR